MSRKHFQNGLSSFQSGNYQEALTHLNEAARHGGQNQHLIFDTRAAVHTKLGNTKEALKDAKKTIEVAPDRWQGYARSARLFLQIKKMDASFAMINMALERLKEVEEGRRASLLSLREEIERTQQAIEKQRLRFMDHTVKLPIELFTEIANMLVAEDHIFVITLSQVSKLWRNVIRGLPNLWNTLVLTRRRPRQKAKLWLERSKGRINELFIRESALTVPHWFGDGLEELKWEHLRVFKIQQWNVAKFLSEIGKLHSLPNLEQLELNSVPSSNSFPFGEDSLLSPKGKIQLKDLNLISITLSIRNLPKQITTLTSLTLQVFDGKDLSLSEFLQANPKLEKLSLTCVVSSDMQMKEGFDMLHLTHLETKGYHPDFIFSLGLPLLQCLRVESPPVSLDPCSLFRGLIGKGSKLKELVFRSCHFDSDTLISLLLNSPNLEVLEISNTTSKVPIVLEALCGPIPLSESDTVAGNEAANIGVICPKLTHLNFSKCPDVQTGPLFRLVKSRLPHGSNQPHKQSTDAYLPASILSLIIDECPKFDSSWLPWFRERIPNVSCVFMQRNTKFRV